MEAPPLRPLFVEERGHGRDGELLRDFIMRKEHLKEDCLAGGAFLTPRSCWRITISICS